MIRLRGMTRDEFAIYEDREVHRYARANVEAGYWDPQEALRRAREAHARLIPQGLETPDHHFFILEETSTYAPVGFLWASVDRQAVQPSVFLFDIYIEEASRGKGYGREAMMALEAWAMGLGIRRFGLHVFASNEVAQSLYRQLGYRVASLNMVKELTGDV